jgi:hypothetical protein
VLQTAATDVPRFDHNPTTLESLGLLVEEQRTNLLVQSNGFDTTWVNTNSSETAASGTAPDGTNTAWELKDTVDGSAVVHSIAQQTSITSGTTYSYTAWIKAGTLGFAAISFPSAGFTTGVVALFNLSTGASSVTSGTATASTVAYSNGWYRCSVTATATASVSTALNIRIANSISTSTYQGDGTGTILIFGADLQAGAFPTSYIPTTTAAVTRSADVASITGSAFSSWYRQDEGTVFVNGSAFRVVESAGGFLTLNDPAGGNRVDIRQFRVQPILQGGAGSAVTWSGVMPTITPNVSFMQAVAYSSNSHGDAISGTLEQSSTALLPIAATRMALFMRDGQTAPSGGTGGTIRRICFWPQRLSNASLQQLTQ